MKKNVNFGVQVSELSNCVANVAPKWCTVKECYIGYRNYDDDGYPLVSDEDAPEKDVYCIIRLDDIIYAYVEDKGILFSNKIICSFYELRQLFAGHGKSSLADVFRQEIYSIFRLLDQDKDIVPQKGVFVSKMKGLSIQVSQVVFNEPNDQGMYLVKGETLNAELASEKEYDHPIVVTKLEDYRLDISDTRMFQLAEMILEHKSQEMKVKAVAFSMKRTKFLYMDVESEAIWQQVVDELASKQEKNSEKTVAQSTVENVLAVLQAQLNQATADGNIDAMVKLAEAIAKFK